MSGVPADTFESAAPELRVAEAQALLAARLPLVAQEEVLPVSQGAGRILAAPLMAPFPLPPFDHAAVDGYAFRLVDCERLAGVLPVGLRVPAGAAPGALPAGVAARIFTGALLPPGADCVVMQEDVSLSVAGDRVSVPAAARRAGRNIRREGEEFAAGALILPAGRRLGPAELALAASLGLGTLRLRKPLRVTLFSTGDELLAGEGKPGPGRRFDSNRPMLAALLRGLGCTVLDAGIVPDDPASLRSAFASAAAGSDAIVTSGGVSAGEEDHVRAAIAACGTVQRWLMALKPGRVLAMGVIDGVPVIGLPGNPVAAMNAFLHVARPALERLAGAEDRPLLPFPVRAGFSHAKRAGRLEALRVRLVAGPGGLPEARLFGADSSGWLSSLTEGDGLALAAEDHGDVRPGDSLGFLPFRGLF